MRLHETNLNKSLVKTGVVAGIALAFMYPARKLLPLPDSVGTAFFIYFGPLIVVTFVGLFPFLTKERKSVSAILGTLFGVLAGFGNMLFSVVQLTNLHYSRRYMRLAESPELQQMWQNILNGVFTVQNGINYATDFFLDWAVILFAIVMWTHPRFGKIFSIIGIVAAGSHFLMKAYTFPEPPAEAGLFDAGPLVSIWNLIIVIQILRNLSWMDTNKSSSND